ncbi:MAG: MiaB/RimO family radical SAM methylthiotransferase, partial [Deltaproteobacteria bacterium]|nr:MiaB/RimO family radical SAM methylthiotransferase [Deltaproteobacteria bacterium]
MKSYLIKTFGCKANYFDSQFIESELVKHGWTKASFEHPKTEEVSLCIVNTCTVTDTADKQSVKTVKKLSTLYPQAKILVAGCSAEVNPEKYHKKNNFILGNKGKNKIIQTLNRDFHPVGVQEFLSRHPMDREWPLVQDTLFPPEFIYKDSTARARVFLKIQEGCNAFCTFCIIPYGRGPSRSLAIADVISYINSLVQNGTKEIVLTGTNLGDYGKDWAKQSKLLELLQTICSETKLERLRVSSLDPLDINSKMLTWARTAPKFCNHFHVSLQSPCSKILKLMKRKYTAQDVHKSLCSISKLADNVVGGVFIGMDIITGFPGETEQDFDWTVHALEYLPWTRLHVFPY